MPKPKTVTIEVPANSCIAKAIERGQPYFTLMAQDKYTLGLMRLWQLWASRSNSPKTQRRALRLSGLIKKVDRWQKANSHLVKAPD